MSRYKKWNIGLVIATALIAAVVWLYWEFICTEGGCTWELRNFIFRPLIWVNIPLAIITATLLFFPPHLFKRWLQHIASWFTPLALFAILSTDPRSSEILSLDRGQVAWLLGTLLLFLTVLYAMGWHLYEWRKGRLLKNDFAKLLIFIIPTLIFYAIWQLF